MSATSAPPSIPAQPLPVDRQSRTIRWAAVGAGTVAVLVVLTLLTLGNARNGVPYDPDNPHPGGAQALRRVLEQRGVQVDVVRSQHALVARGLTAQDTLLVVTTADLSHDTAATLWAQARSAGRLVLLGAGSTVLDAMDLPLLDESAYRAQPVAAGCSEPDADRAGTLSQAVTAYRARQGSDGTTLCFRTSDGAGYLADVPASGLLPQTTVLGSRDFLTNEVIPEQGNAALALGLLGDLPRLVWYVPSLDDIPAGDASALQSALPSWLAPSRLLVVAALLALFLWRGRRLGRLVVEPLPVVVRAVETTESRARLYRRARDRHRALAVLRAASRRRLAAYLGLPVSAAEAQVVRAVAEATGQPEHDVAEVLLTAWPEDDPALLALTGRLAALEKEIHRA